MPLMLKLQRNGILSLGTIRQNRKAGAQKVLETAKEMKKKGRGSYDWRVDIDSNIVVTKWQDNSTVQLASTFVHNSMGENVRRWSAKEGAFVDIAQG